MYEDRDRIARDLHDLVIQRLYATGMSLQGTMPMISRPEVADRVTRAVDAMDETIKEIRGAIFALQARDAEVPRDPRADIVRLVEEMTEMLGFAPSLRLGPGLRTLGSEELAEQALIVLREALSNVARHAGATQADVTVDVDEDGFLTVTVTDNGTGIPPEAQAQRPAQPRGARRGARRRAAAEPGRARCRRDRGPGWSGGSRPPQPRRRRRTASRLGAQAEGCRPASRSCSRAAGARPGR